MKTILVPVDFSENSRAALHAAELLARNLNYQILLLHVYNPSIGGYYNENGITMPGVSQETDYDYINNKLNLWAKEVTKKTKVKCNTLLTEGVSAYEITETAEKKKVAIIIMGTKRPAGIKKIINGSVANQVVKESKLPVLIVPDKTSLKNKIHTTVLATDYHDSDLAAIKLLANIGNVFSSKIIIVHVEDGELNEYSEQDLLDWFAGKVKKVTKYRNIFFKLIKSEKTVGEALDNFIKKNKVDMLAVSMRKKDIIETLFTPATTTEVLNHTPVPVLVFQAADKSNGELF